MTRPPPISTLFPHPPLSRPQQERRRPPRRDAPDRPRRDVRAEGVEVAVGHVHDPHDAVDEAQAARDEEEDRRVEQRVEEVDDEDVHYSATRNGITFTSGFTRLPLRASATSTR